MTLRPPEEIEVVLDAGATIGESPTWSPDEGFLYWIDVKMPALHRFEPGTGRQKTWLLTSDVGGFALAPEEDGAVVALREGVFALSFATGALSMLAPPPFDPTLFRFNEGACDSAGRLWIGVMFDPLQSPAPPRQRGHLYTFSRREGLREQPDTAVLHNGMAWSVDESLFYLSHSYDQQVFAFDFDVASGRISERRTFACLPRDLGIPDGAAIDTEGGYWSACHGGGRLRRYLSDGTFDRDLILPVTQPTMCAFGGEDLDELYVTTARDKLDPAQLARETHAGAVFRVSPGVRGIPRNCRID